MYFDQLLPSTAGLALIKAASASAQRSQLGLGSASTLNATNIVQSVNGLAPDVSGNVLTRNFTSGTVGATAVVIPLATYLLVGAPHTLNVTPDTGCTLQIEYSLNNGANYVVYDTTTVSNIYQYTMLPGESAITHLRITRTAGTSNNSTYYLSGGVDYAQYPAGSPAISITAANISDSSAAGRALLTAADVTTQNALLGTSGAITSLAGMQATFNSGSAAEKAAFQSSVAGVFNEMVSLHPSAIPLIIPGSGTVSTNGALVLGTANSVIYSDSYVYLPAGAAFASSIAGFYYVKFTTLTTGTIYNNVYSPGANFPSIVAVPTAISAAGPGAFTGPTTEIDAVVVTVTGGAMGVNGRIHIQYYAGGTNSAGNKTVKIYYGDTNLNSSTMTTQLQLCMPLYVIQNRGKLTSQYTPGSAFSGTSTSAPVATSIDSSVDQIVKISLTHSSAATDNIVLESCNIDVWG